MKDSPFHTKALCKALNIPYDDNRVDALRARGIRLYYQEEAIQRPWYYGILFVEEGYHGPVVDEFQSFTSFHLVDIPKVAPLFMEYDWKRVDLRNPQYVFSILEQAGQQELATRFKALWIDNEQPITPLQEEVSDSSLPGIEEETVSLSVKEISPEAQASLEKENIKFQATEDGFNIKLPFISAITDDVTDEYSAPSEWYYKTEKTTYVVDRQGIFSVLAKA